MIPLHQLEDHCDELEDVARGELESRGERVGTLSLFEIMEEYDGDRLQPREKAGLSS